MSCWGDLPILSPFSFSLGGRPDRIIARLNVVSPFSKQNDNWAAEAMNAVGVWADAFANSTLEGVCVLGCFAMLCFSLFWSPVSIIWTHHW